MPAKDSRMKERKPLQFKFVKRAKILQLPLFWPGDKLCAATVAIVLWLAL
jgi:hypothetical protein